MACAINDRHTKPDQYFEKIDARSAEYQTDIDLIESFKKTDTYNHHQNPVPKEMESYFNLYATHYDWFGNALVQQEDSAATPLTIIPTSVVDDHFNHVDSFCTVANQYTDWHYLPFAIDFTSNFIKSELWNKFDHLHLSGPDLDAINAKIKTDRANHRGDHEEELYIMKEVEGEEDFPGKNSEFNLLVRYSKGLKFPGFSAVKYTVDLAHLNIPDYPRGSVPVVPRFITGYSQDWHEILISDGPDPNNQKYLDGEADYLADLKDFERAQEIAQFTAKWCVLLECQEQAHQVQYMLQNNVSESGSFEYRRQLTEAKKLNQMCVDYFDFVLEKSKEMYHIVDQKPDPDAPDAIELTSVAQIGYECALRDPVRRSTSDIGQRIYVERDWKHMQQH